MMGRLLFRRPLKVRKPFAGDPTETYEALGDVLECGHPIRSLMGGNAGYEFYCEECAKIPHPRTNPGGYPARHRAKMALSAVEQSGSSAAS